MAFIAVIIDNDAWAYTSIIISSVWAAADWTSE